MLLGTVTWLLNKPPTAECASEAPADHKGYGIPATKVVVRPWLGPHHVYAIFVVPNRYKHNKSTAATMTVRAFDHSFLVGAWSDKQYVDGVFAEPGSYLLSRYIPTRVALWYLVTGRFGDLRRPCNWRLAFMERSP